MKLTKRILDLAGIKEEFVTSGKMRGDYYEIFKNPSTREIGDTIGRELECRGFLYKTGDLYIWPAEILHEIMLKDRLIELLNIFTGTKNGLKAEYPHFFDGTCVYVDKTKIWDATRSYFFPSKHRMIMNFKKKNPLLNFDVEMVEEMEK